MPTIPMYNQGQGSAVELVAGSLSPRADVGAFAAPGQALAQFASSAGDIAFKLGVAERNREDERIITEETARAFEESSQFVIQDQSTTVEEAGDKFNVFRDEFISKLNDKGYGSRRSGLIKNKLASVFSEQLITSQQNANTRGNKLATKALDSEISLSLSKLKGIDPNSDMFDVQTLLLRTNIAKQSKVGIEPTLNIFQIDSQIEAIRNDGFRTGHADLIESASSVEQVETLIEQVSGLSIDPASQDVLRRLGEQKINEIEVAEVNEFVSYIDVSNVGKTAFDTVESIDAQIEAASSGDFGANKDLAEKWDKLSDGQKLSIRDGWAKARTQAIQNYNFNIQRADRVEKETNEKIYLDNKDRIMSGELTIESVRGLPFEGAGGDLLKSQLVDLVLRRSSGDIATTSNSLVHKGTKSLVATGAINSITQPYTVYGDDEETKAANGGQGKSLVERMGDSISESDFDAFEQDIRLRTTQFLSEADKQLSRDFSLFNAWLTDNEKIAKGGNILKFSTPGIERHWVDVQAQWRARFIAGLNKGIPAEDLLNPRNENYLIRSDEDFSLSMDAQMQSLQDAFKPRPEYTLQEVLPPKKKPGQSLDDYLNSDEYLLWSTSDKAERYKELNQ